MHASTRGCLSLCCFQLWTSYARKHACCLTQFLSKLLFLKFRIRYLEYFCSSICSFILIRKWCRCSLSSAIRLMQFYYLIMRFFCVIHLALLIKPDLHISICVSFCIKFWKIQDSKFFAQMSWHYYWLLDS